MDFASFPSRIVALALLAAGAAHAAGEPPGFDGMVDAHNGWRKLVGVPPVAWSADAASQAQAWADQLAKDDCKPRYNPDPARRERFGENVLRAWGDRPYEGFRRTPQQVVDRWGEEGRFYDLATNTCSAPPGRICGHYLQLMWQETRVVGCGRARCPKAEIWVCDYTPRGGQAGFPPYGGTRPPRHAELEVPPEESPPLACYAPGAEPPAMSPAVR